MSDQVKYCFLLFLELHFNCKSELNNSSYLNRFQLYLDLLMQSELSSMSNLGTVISLLVYGKCAKSLVINSISCGDVVADFRRNANISYGHLLRLDKRKIHSYMILDFCYKHSQITNSELRIYWHIKIQMKA